MAESVDLLAPGRVVIGLGLGWNAEEHAAAGLDFPGVAERSKRLEKGIGRVRSELGQHRIPIMVGGKGRRSTLPVVARCADWWNTTTSSEAEFVQLAEVLDGLCGEVGRDPSEIRRSIAVGFLVGRDEADLEQRGRRMRNVVPPLAASSDVLTAARDMGWFVGTVEQVAAALADFDRAGVDDVILGHYNLEDVDALELMASLV
jgi:alkanesulfonate monooxygenase SsuD/methylene tetrahydromethanopterin reductase-like flavin-dependent oxidoreductase (luciferase family)